MIKLKGKFGSALFDPIGGSLIFPERGYCVSTGSYDLIQYQRKNGKMQSGIYGLTATDEGYQLTDHILWLGTNPRNLESGVRFDDEGIWGWGTGSVLIIDMETLAFIEVDHVRELKLHQDRIYSCVSKLEGLYVLAYSLTDFKPIFCKRTYLRDPVPQWGLSQSVITMQFGKRTIIINGFCCCSHDGEVFERCNRLGMTLTPKL